MTRLSGRILVLTAVALATAVLWFTIGVHEAVNQEVRSLVDRVGGNLFRVLRQGGKFGQEEFALLDALPEVIAVGGEGGTSVHHTPGRPYTLTTLSVSHNYTEVSRLPLIFGRAFSEDEHRSAILGWEVSEVLFGEQDPIGKQVDIAGRDYAVVGVLAPIPADDHRRIRLNRLVLVPTSEAYWALLVRVRGDRRAAQDAILQALPEVDLRSTHDEYDFYFFLERTIGRVMLSGAVGLFLLAGTVVAGMFFVFTLQRGWEIGLRRAVGATVNGNVRMLVAEGIRIAFWGGLAGCILAWAATPLMSRLGSELTLSWLHLSVLPMAVAVGALFSLFPSWKAARLSPALALSLRTMESRRGMGMGGGRAIIGFAVAVGVGGVFLLAGFIGSYERFLTGLWGPIDEYTFVVSVPRRTILPPPPLSGADLLALRQVLGVEAAVLSGVRTVSAGLSVYGVGDGYETLGLLAIEQGRDLTADEIRQGERVAVVGRFWATTRFGDEDPIGRTLRIMGETYRVVGVHNDMSAARIVEGHVIIPYGSLEGYWITHRFWLRAAADADLASTKNAVSAMIRTRHPNKERVEIFFPAGQVADARETISGVATNLGLLVIFGAIIGAGGVFNLVSFLLLLRTRELAIRRAVGARRLHVIMIGVREALKITIPGSLVGVVLGSLLLRPLQDWFFLPNELSANLIWITIVGALLVGGVAGGWPAWRASCPTPAAAIRRGMR